MLLEDILITSINFVCFCMGVRLASLALWEEKRPKVLENRVLRTIFGPKRAEVTGEWRRLHTEELYSLYSPNIRAIKSRRMRWVAHVAHVVEEKCIRGLVGRPEERRPLGRHRRRWDDNIKVDLQEGREARAGLLWLRIGTGWRALLNAVMHVRFVL
jgi:hypothetical protein